MLVDRDELTSGSTFHSAGLVGQLRGSVSLTRMMMHSVELYRTLDCGWVECGGLRLASSPERREETRRQAGWAKTFGLPLELISAEEAHERFPLMATDGVLGASWLPTDGYLDPSLLTYALAEGAREAGCDIHTNTRVTGDRRRRRPRARRADRPRRHRGRRRRQRGRHVRGRDRPAGGRARADRPDGARVPRHAAVPRARATSTCRRCATPTTSIYFREEGGGLVMGGYERHRAPWALDEDGVDAIPADFNGRLLEEDWDRFEEITVNARMRVPVMDEVTITRLINGPEAFTPDNEFCLGESDGARLLRRRRLLRARAGGRGRHRQGDGGVDRRGRAAARPLADGHPPLRRALPLARLHARAHARGLRDLLRHQVPRPRAPGGAAAARLARLRLARRARRRVRREVGLGAGQLVRGQRGGGRRVAAPARLGRAALVAGDRRRARAPRARPPRCSTRPRSPSSRSAGRAPPSCSSACATTASRATSGKVTYTQMLNGRGGIECDFTVTRLAEDRFWIVTGTAFGNHDLAWIASPRGDGRARRGRHLALGLRRAVGPAGARRSSRRCTPDPLDFPYMNARGSRSATCPCARCA